MIADEAWLTRDQWNTFSEYEETCTETVSRELATSVCAYPLGMLSAAQLMDLTQTHQFAGVRRKGKWALFETSELKAARSELGVPETATVETAGSLSPRTEHRRGRIARLLSYGLSVLLVALAASMLLPIANWMHGDAPYTSLLVFAVISSAWFGGFGPGLLSAALSVFAFTYHLFVLSHSPELNVTRVIIMAILAVLVALVTAAQRHATNDARASRDTLRRNNALLQSEIMERIRAMDSLHETNDRLEMIVNNSPLPITGMDSEGRITDWNKAAEELFGWTAQEAIGRTCPSVPQQGMDEFKKMISTAMRGEVVRGLVSLRQKRSGGLLSCRISTAPRKNADGRPIGVTVILEDITEKRRIEEEMLASRERLKALSRRLLEAQEMERKQVAYELHDELGQVLTAAKISLEAVPINGNTDGLASRIRDSIEIIERSLQRVRDLSLNLRPWVLDNLGLVPALRWFIDRQAQIGNLKGRLVAKVPEERYPPLLEIVCFRIVQESITNVLRHAAATEILVSLERNGDELVLTVKDNGTGFDLEEKRSAMGAGSSAGLFGIEERASLVGGRAEIHTKPGGGTIVAPGFPSLRPKSGRMTRGQGARGEGDTSSSRGRPRVGPRRDSLPAGATARRAGRRGKRERAGGSSARGRARA